jgi:hypothetical protein
MRWAEGGRGRRSIRRWLVAGSGRRRPLTAFAGGSLAAWNGRCLPRRLRRGSARPLRRERDRGRPGSVFHGRDRLAWADIRRAAGRPRRALRRPLRRGCGRRRLVRRRRRALALAELLRAGPGALGGDLDACPAVGAQSSQARLERLDVQLASTSGAMESDAHLATPTGVCRFEECSLVPGSKSLMPFYIGQQPL